MFAPPSPVGRCGLGAGWVCVWLSWWVGIIKAVDGNCKKQDKTPCTKDCCGPWGVFCTCVVHCFYGMKSILCFCSCGRLVHNTVLMVIYTITVLQ